MARFDNFEPAPLNQGTLDRLGRGTAGGAIGGVKGAFAGVGILWGTPLVLAATTIGLGFFALPLVTGAAAVAVGVAVVIGAVATGLTAWAATLGTGFAALGGGIYGAAKGLSKENQRAGLDQSLYNAVVAEAVARGSAQGQALAYTQQQMPAQATFIQPQPQAQVRQQPEAPAPVELSPAANDNVAPMTGSPAKVAAKDAAYEGTVIASKQQVSQL